MKPTPITALIDADTLVYEAATKTEQPTKWDDELWTLHGWVEDALPLFSNKVQEIIEKVQADKFILCLSDRSESKRWRENYLPTYKAHRRDSRKPVHFYPLLDAIEEKYAEQVYIRPTLEADDILGILATHPKIVKGQKVVVSLDKDMQTIPGDHYNYKHEKYSSVSALSADYMHLMQTLTGDATDGYAGCPGIGPVKAQRLLDSVFELCHAESEIEITLREAWRMIVAQFQKAGLSEEVALQNARVARICRHTDYDFDKKEVILWNPPK